MRRTGRKLARAGSWRLAAALAAVLGAAGLQGSSADEKAREGALHTLPASGRAYEVLVPPGQPEGPAGMPLVLYLHPAGEPRLDRARRDYWPILAKRNCLMVLPRAKAKTIWPAGEEKYVLDVLTDVQARHRIDPKRICLLGVSGGGQVALFLADHLPERFRAVIVVSTNPVVIRGKRQEWFYPARKVLKACPYFVVNHITQGSALMYWRQVRARLAPAGASISILPVTGEAEQYQPPPKPLGAWLDEVLTGKHPKPIPDPQAAAVAEMFGKCAAALPKAISTTRPSPAGPTLAKDGKVFRLAVGPPKDFQRSEGEQAEDSTAAAMTQIRMEHRKWPVYLRCEARATEKPMADVLSAEEGQTILRGMLYQVYRRGTLDVGGRNWSYKIGSITYPDRRRGWVSTLFLHAAAAVKNDPTQWLTVLVGDETQKPDAEELAGIFKTALVTLTARAVAEEK